MALVKTKIDGKNNVYSASATGAAAIAETLAPGATWELKEIRMELSAAGGTAENFTVTMDNSLGATYDVVIFSQDMEAVVNLSQTYDDRERRFKADDELDFAYNNNNTRTWGMEIIYKLY